MKCKDYEYEKIVRLKALNGVNYVEIIKKLLNYCKECNKKYKDCKRSLEYIN